MPRKSPSRTRSTSRSRSKTRADPLDALLPSMGTVRSLLGKLGDIAVGLGFISLVSFTPQSWIQQLPPHGQTAMDIAKDVRILLADIGGDAFEEFGAWLDRLDLSDLRAQWPKLPEFLELPDPRDWLAHVPTRSPEVPPGHTPRTANSFGKAKDMLYDTIYRGHRTTFYCGCDYNSGRQVELGSCGLDNYSGSTRAQRVEAEHVFPASQFGSYRACWRNPERFDACRRADGDVVSGRDCCQRVDDVFRAAHNDLHNLVPVDGLINGQRSNHNWGMVPDARGGRYGACDIRIDAGIRRVQPPKPVRGDIARIMLYMEDTYGFRLSRQDRQLYAAWNNADPPDDWEIKRNRRIARLQGKDNGYVTRWRQM